MTNAIQTDVLRSATVRCNSEAKPSPEINDQDRRAEPRCRTRRTQAQIAPEVAARAIGISLIVFNHAAVVPSRSFEWGGGLSVLLLVAGFTFARFSVDGGDGTRLRAGIRSYAINFGTPCLIVVLLSFLIRRSFSWSELLFVHRFFSRDHIALFYSWYAEAFLHSLFLIWILSLWKPWASRLQRSPWTTSLVTAAATAAILVFIDHTWAPEVRHPQDIMWQFFLGWAIYFARPAPTPFSKYLTLVGSALLSVFALSPTQPLRIPLFIATAALLLFAPPLAVGKTAARIASLISQASLSLFLTHWMLLRLADRLHLRNFSSTSTYWDVLIGWIFAMCGGILIWLVLSSGWRAWHYMRLVPARSAS